MIVACLSLGFIMPEDFREDKLLGFYNYKSIYRKTLGD